ncbi:MAG: cytochrome c [Candidatus Binatia bacterium]|nr:MAG: cytochrome c [Candidatus Binatia bacterium]
MRALMVGTIFWIAAVAWAHDSKEPLPEGPIRERHELMERVGKQAKVIGDALKAGKLDPVGPAAEKIAAEAGKALPLFPEGSTHPRSRAKAEIWQQWDEFEKLMRQLEADAKATAEAAQGGGDVRAAANKMFGNCKSCHDRFRLPEKK